MRSGGPARTMRLAAVFAAGLLAGCTSAGDFQRVSLQLPTEATLKTAVPKAAERENARILASYGGTYDNAKLQAVIEKTVARLVAASERPDLTYTVVILNSPAIN